jgi:hypothetical protein
MPRRRSGDCLSIRLQGSQTRVNSRIFGGKVSGSRKLRKPEAPLDAVSFLHQCEWPRNLIPIARPQGWPSSRGSSRPHWPVSPRHSVRPISGPSWRPLVPPTGSGGRSGGANAPNSERTFTSTTLADLNRVSIISPSNSGAPPTMRWPPTRGCFDSSVELEESDGQGGPLASRQNYSG